LWRPRGRKRLIDKKVWRRFKKWIIMARDNPDILKEIEEEEQEGFEDFR